MSETAHSASLVVLPSIAYVDEKEDERANFYTDAFDSGLFSEIHLIEAFPELSDTLEKILELDIDAFVTDFNLTEEGPVGYNGEQLVEEILAVRKDFPCFIRTSFEKEALAVSVDVNRVYSKDLATDEHSNKPLFNRVALQIQKHQNLVAEWRTEMEHLLSMPAASRSAIQVDRILDLDAKLEAAFGADAVIPIDVKREIFSNRNDLHLQAERLIADMKRELGDEV